MPTDPTAGEPVSTGRSRQAHAKRRALGAGRGGRREGAPLRVSVPMSAPTPSTAIEVTMVRRSAGRTRLVAARAPRPPPPTPPGRGRPIPALPPLSAPRHHRGEPPRRGERSFPQVRCGIYGDVGGHRHEGQVVCQVGPRRVGTVQRHRPGAVESNQAPVDEMLRPTGEDGHTCDHEGQAGDGIDRLPEKPRAEPLAVEVGYNRFGVT